MALPHEERTLILVKPDGVSRGLIGETIKRFEQRGFRILGLKMLNPTLEQMRGHYSGGEAWVRQLGQRTLGDMEKYEKDPLKEFGTTDELEIGKKIVDWLVEFMSPGPIAALVISGPNAVEMARKIVGSTVPQKADIGSIRGDYSIDSPMSATLEKRPIKNLLHASGSLEEAEKEVAHWFSEAELCAYEQ